MAIGRRVAFALAGTAAATVSRRLVRRAMHNREGRIRMPERARVRKGFGTTLAWAAGTGVLLGVADVLSEQRQDASGE